MARASNRALKIETLYKSGLEEKIAQQLEAAGVEFDYEGLTVPYEIPARTANYKADFPCRDTVIVLEGKGHFGANNFGRRFANMTDTSAKERKKFVLLKEQHPELDIRFIFSKASAPIYKGSKTTHAQWAENNGFKWCEKVVPLEWIEEILQQQKRTNGNAKRPQRTKRGG